MRAKRGNRQYQIMPAQLDTYLKQGFDVYDDKGELIQYGAGKTASYEDYQKALDELRSLKETEPDNSLLEGLQLNNEELVLENEALKSQIEELKLDLEALQTTKSKK